MLMAGAHFAVPLFVLPPHLGHPRCGPPLEFRVLLVSPGADGSFKGLDLTEAHQLLLGSLGKKAATATLTDQPVDLRGELLRDDNVSAFCSHDNVSGPPLDWAAKGPLQVYHLWDFRQPPPACLPFSRVPYTFSCVYAHGRESCRTLGAGRVAWVADIKTNVGATRRFRVEDAGAVPPAGCSPSGNGDDSGRNSAAA